MGVLIDHLCGDALERAWFLLRVAVDAGLGLSVDERGDGGELGVVGVVDGLDAVLLPELVGREGGTGRRRETNALRTGRLGQIHEWKEEKERREAPTVFGTSSSFVTSCDSTIPTMA